MAPVIGFVAKILATKLIAGLTVGAIVKVAAAYAINRILNKSKGKGLGSGSGSQLTMSRDPSPARRIVYGETRVSGPIAFIHVAGDKNSTLALALMLAAHECDQIGAYLVEDVQVTPDETGAVTTGKYAGKLWINAHLGDQTAGDAGLIAMSGGAWTTAHALKGITYIACRLTYDTEVYAGGLPNFSVIMRGKKVFDPRTETTAFSRNPALVLRDYLTNDTFGLGATADEIDDASFIAAANICDESVALAEGGTEPRYRCDGTFTTDAEPAAVIEQILATMAGSLVYAGGKFRCHAGAYVAPTVTLDEGDLRGPIQFQPAAGIREVCNIVKGSYTSPVDLYQPRDIPQFRDATHITADGEEIPTDLDLAWVSSPSQAQRLAKIHERASRLGGVLTLQCNLSAMRVQAGDTIAVNNTRFGWAPKVFRVQEFKFSIEAGGALGVDLICRETAASIWEWTAATDEQATDPAAEVENPEIDYRDMVGVDGEPGTIDDLNGATGGSAPVGDVVDQARGGVWAKVGFAEYTPDSGSSSQYARYRMKTGTGSIYLSGGQLACSYTWATTGTSSYGAASGTLDSVMHFTLDGVDQGERVSGEYQGVIPSCGNGYFTYHSTRTRTVLTEWMALSDGSLGGSTSGSHVVTLSGEDTADDAAARAFAAHPWSTIGSNATRTPESATLTGVRVEVRWGTYALSGAVLTYTPLTGLQPWTSYCLRRTTRQRPVDATGAATGDWVELPDVVAPFLADLAGTGGVEWQYQFAPEGWEINLGAPKLEVY